MATAGGGRGAGPERAFCPDLAAAAGALVTLDGDESAHLVRSRRAQADDPVVLFDGAGVLRAGTLETPDPRAAAVRLGGDYPARDPARRVRLAVGLPEMGRCDRMVAMLAELGVAGLAPLTSRRGDPGRPAQAQRRAARWAKLAREALKVNGASQALALLEPIALADAAAEGAVLLDPDPAARPLRAVLADACPTPWLVLGPEGGFDDQEVASARAAGAAVARLGRPALRVETAAVAAASVALA